MRRRLIAGLLLDCAQWLRGARGFVSRSRQWSRPGRLQTHRRAR